MSMENSKSHEPLHLCHVHNLSNIINRIHTLFHSTALSIFFYYRASLVFFKQTHDEASCTSVPLLPWLLIFISELLLSLIWFLGQAYRWRRVSRRVFPERLPEDIDDKLPGIDVFICTVDPIKEPTIGVMNTVISAMSLDYPPEKLNVYVSDDGGSSITLNSVREAWSFAKSWVVFCRKFGIKNRCPEAYFLSEEDDDFGSSTNSSTALKLRLEKQNIKEKYEHFKKRVGEYTNDGHKRSGNNTTKNQPAFIEVMKEMPRKDVESTHNNIEKMPLLVYVSREKRPSHPHNFKAGALNVLLRVSGVISNSAYVLVLDCDMYSNDPTSARKAMCFHLDPEISPSLAFVQFPQRFHNVSSSDIYDSQLRSVFSVQWEGMDGLGGPCVSGTCFFMKRLALYGSSISKDMDLMKLKKSFGLSNEFIKSIVTNYKLNIATRDNDTSPKEMQLLASCTYENGTKWGKEVGFLYGSVLEDYLTSMTSLHSKGWTSIYCNPTRPQFLGCGTTNLNEVLIQGTRWLSGLVEVCFSKYCPFIFGAFGKLSLLQTMCYAQLAVFPLYFVPLWCFATIPQLCLVNGIPLYPEVSSPFFSVLIFIFLSSILQHLYEVLESGATFQTWINEQRIWMMKSVTSHLYGTIDAFMGKIGLREASFLPTNKVDDDEQVLLYQKGIFDFRTSTMFLVPLASLFILNVIAFLVGIARVMIFGEDFKKMFVQVFITIYILVMNYPIFEGMVIRKDKGSIPLPVTLVSSLFTIIFIILGSIIFHVLRKFKCLVG